MLRNRIHAALAVGLLAAMFVLTDHPAAAITPHKTEPGEMSEPETHFVLDRPFVDDAEHPIEHTYLYGASGVDRNGFHTGVDIRSTMGDPIMAGAAGQVVYAGDDSTRLFATGLNFYGRLVLLKAEQGYCPGAGTEGDIPACSGLPIYLLYGHMDQIFVQTGQTVKDGDVLGTVGMTGIAMGPHLHFEVRLGIPYFIAAVNPGLWLTPRPGFGVIAGKVLDAAGDPLVDDRVLIYKIEEDERLWRVVSTYPSSYLIHSDYALQENFVLPDVPPGRYRIVAGHGGTVVGLSVTVSADQMTFVELPLSG